MMSIRGQISDIIGSAPEDLVAFYEQGDFPAYPESRINCLPFEGARQYSSCVNRVSDVERLGLWFLDDANDSNPFAYISKGPCAGMIIHFSHDPEPAITFSSLASFLAKMHGAGKLGLDIDDIENDSLSLPLNKDIYCLAQEDTDEATALITYYLPVCSLLEDQTKASLLEHSDFFVREAFALFLTRVPCENDLEFAEHLANDRHPQVAREGKKALGAVKRKRYEG
jgi:hypothetical protein